MPSPSRSPSFPHLRASRFSLRIPEQRDAEAILLFHQRNETFLEPTSPPPPMGYLTLEYWQAQIARIQQEFQEGTSCRFFLFASQDSPQGPTTQGEDATQDTDKNAKEESEEAEETVVIGKLSLSQIFRGPFCACYMGYALDQHFEGKGYMYEAGQRVIGYTFEELRLHRIMANYMPSNERSGRLLRRLGFVVEGYARDYLFIHGAWRDHILTSLTAPVELWTDVQRAP